MGFRGFADWEERDPGVSFSKYTLILLVLTVIDKMAIVPRYM